VFVICAPRVGLYNVTTVQPAKWVHRGCVVCHYNECHDT